MGKTVFDTNIYISAFITKGGRGETTFLLAVNRTIELYTSVPILAEMAKKLREKFRWDDEPVKRAVKYVAAVAQVVKPEQSLHVLVDEPDNRILECAQCSGAEFIVTGDRHLLNLDEFESCRIVTLADFLDLHPMSLT